MNNIKYIYNKVFTAKKLMTNLFAADSLYEFTLIIFKLEPFPLWWSIIIQLNVISLVIDDRFVSVIHSL